MPLVQTDTLTIFFAHIPKAGGTSVEAYLEARFGPLRMMDMRPRGHKSSVFTTPTHLSAEDVAELLPQRVDYSFAVVRDPLDRILSEYRYQKRMTRTSRLSFSTWLRLALKGAQIDPRVYDNHIRPQVDLIPEDAEVFRLEDGFDALIARLDEIEGKPSAAEMPRLNAREKQEIGINAEDAALIAKFYGQDYQRLGYTPPNEASLKSDAFASVRSPFAALLAHLVVFKQRWNWAR
ncbi:MAG: sulfotransferase family 2 domain-containing protein [Pseudomonadota bacterium]